MFRISTIISFLVVSFLNCYATNLTITKEGIYSKQQMRIIDTNIKLNSSSSYDFYIDNILNSGESLVYEANSQYKKFCYIPIINEKKSYKINKITCFELDYPINGNPYWYATTIQLKQYFPIGSIDIKDIIDSENSNIVKKTTFINGKIVKASKYIIFQNLNLFSLDESIISKDTIFKINFRDSIPNFNLNDIVIKSEELTPPKHAIMYKIILPAKQPLYSSPNVKTKMYLIKGDKVEILEEKEDWLYILYHAKKKDIKAWIPLSAISETNSTDE